jgi:hypothetical protein
MTTDLYDSAEIYDIFMGEEPSEKHLVATGADAGLRELGNLIRMRIGASDAD